MWAAVGGRSVSEHVRDHGIMHSELFAKAMAALGLDARTTPTSMTCPVRGWP
jgi:hypothetical protein